MCKKFDAKVVLSSSWRRNLKDDLTPSDFVLKTKEFYINRGIYDDTDTEILLKTFKQYNIPLIGKTDEEYLRNSLGWDRVGQINRYIKKHLDKNDNFIIIDDEDIFGEAGKLSEEEELLQPHFIRTDFYKDGLNEESFIKACKIFNNKLA